MCSMPRHSEKAHDYEKKRLGRRHPQETSRRRFLSLFGGSGLFLTGAVFSRSRTDESPRDDTVSWNRTEPVALSPRDFSGIDRHAIDAPPHMATSVAELSWYLAQGAQSDSERIRAIYRWLTANVAYDDEGFRTGNYGDLSPPGVLHSRKAVCSGYAALCEALARAMRLEVVTIEGLAKGVGYPSSGQKHSNHAWNAVRLSSGWHLLDATWGAGHLNGAGRFERRFTEAYFLPPPDMLISTHLPTDPRWQLLTPAVTNDEFARRVALRSVAIELNIRPVSHLEERIPTKGAGVKLLLEAPISVDFLARLYHGNQKGDHAVVSRISPNQVQVTLDAVPTSGELRIFARGLHDSGSYYQALSYRMERLPR